MSKDTRAMTEGAVLAALTVLIAILSQYIPLPLVFIVPLPLLVLTYRHGINAAIPVAFAAAMLVGLAAHAVHGVILVLSMGALGLAMGEGLHQGFSSIRVLLWGTVAMVIVEVGTFFATLWTTGINLLEALNEWFILSYPAVVELYELRGVAQELIPSLEQYADFMRIIFPAGLVMYAATFASITYWLGGLVLGKLGARVPKFPKFGEWIFPRWFGFGILAVILLSLLVPNGSAWFSAVLVNGFIVGTLLMLIEGFALAWHFINKLNVGQTAKVLLIGTMALAVTPVFMWAGFADNLADYRGLRRGHDESYPKI